MNLVLPVNQSHVRQQDENCAGDVDVNVVRAENRMLMGMGFGRGLADARRGCVANCVWTLV